MSIVKVQGNASGTGIFTVASPNSNTDRTLTLPDATGTVQVSGQPVSATTGTFSGTISGGSTIGVGGATPAASGAGITFPASQSASTDANTLDDYEEGTWTPVLTPSTGTITSQTCNGNYVKVGKLVTVTFNAQSLTGTMTAISQLTGLPFVISTTTPIGASREWYASGNMWEIVGNTGANTCSIIRYDNSSVCNAQFAWNGTLSYITSN